VPPGSRPFAYDEADQTVTAAMLEQPEFYDADVAVDGAGVWIAWLQFVPGEGDRLWVGRRDGDGWALKEQVTVEAAKIAQPTLTFDPGGQLWLSYEAMSAGTGQWDVFLRARRGEGDYGQPRRVSPGPAGDIRHRVAADPRGGLWVVWQTDSGGQFDIMARRMSSGSNAPSTEARLVSESARGDWQPDVAVTPDGKVLVVWDGYDGRSFNVLARWLIDGRWQPVTAVAASAAFDGRASVACDRRGRAWVLWEEGGENWGKPYRGRPGPWDNMTDSYGPLHRFRKLHLARLLPDGRCQPLADPLPMPNLDRAENRQGRWEGISRLGAFYERGRLTVDRSDRLWVVYRHFYHPQLGIDTPVAHHIEQGWQLFARCLEGREWSKLYAFDVPQRDGLQRLGVAAWNNGLAAVWTTGRTDRRSDPLPRGVALGLVDHTSGAASEPNLEEAEPLVPAPATVAPPPPPEPAVVGATTYHLVRGDLHRHTDLSLCFPFVDGSIDDAYRYAIDVTRMDFLGITDHTRDLAHGDRLSQLWWRCTKEVTRHRLSNTFFPYFSYERSHGATDHNVISLRDDRIRDFPPPLPEFWTELEGDTLTIPHAPVNMKCWEFQNDALRPLLEIYQGCRDISSQPQAHAGLNKGYHLGFIASSDHLSTGASFACVWTPQVAREPIFRSMQARRTFGATDRIRLVFTSGEHWMGERFVAQRVPEFRIEIDGTAPIGQLTVYDNGIPTGRLEVPQNSSSIRTAYRPDESFHGEHYLYVHMVQTDGNQAWSSPIWVQYDNPNPSRQRVEIQAYAPIPEDNAPSGGLQFGLDR
jgi:hypothetical protein